MDYNFGYTEADVKSAHTAGFWSGVTAILVFLGLIGAAVYFSGVVSIQPL